MLSTADWATSFGISVAPTPPEIPDHHAKPAKTAIEIAERVLITHGVVAAAAGVAIDCITDWFKSEGLSKAVSPNEMKFLNDDYGGDRLDFQWHMESEWALLWTIGFVDSLGLPTSTCDSRRLCDEIIPELGSDVTEFIKEATLRNPGVLLSEDDRTYDLWCRWHQGQKNGQPLPDDLNERVLYERRYAFEWLDGHQSWDDVTCDT